MDEVGGYHLGAELGKGGMGIVYRAVPADGGSPVALKVLPAALCDDYSRARFSREAARASAIRHPNVVRVLDFGETAERGLFLAMELLDGEDLETRLFDGPLEPVEIVRIGCAAAAGLHAVHEAGLVHRDVKPGNVFLCRNGEVKVLDFGLAVALPSMGETRMTKEQRVVGTPGYMSIEQARGTRDEDARTDVWGLGATLYHAAVGQPPFRGGSTLAQLVRVVTDEPDPIPPTVPRWLSTVLMRCLQKEKGARWQSMTELAGALVRGFEQTSRATPVPFPRPELVTLGDEVRIVSVLFAENVADAAAFSVAVRAERGVASPLLGERAVGVFGGQAWQGDEAERAVRAGLAVRAAGMASRIGVATGRAVRARAGDVTGEVVLVAQTVASAEGLGADGETRKRIVGGFTVEGGRVLSRREGARVIGVRGPGGADVPLYDRGPEIADLRATLRKVVERSQAAGVLLTGPPGIGKSRLRHAFELALEAMPEAILVLEARGEAHRKLKGWHAVANGLRLRAELPEGTPPEVVQDRLLSICPTRENAEFIGEILGAQFPDSPHLETARSDPGIMRNQVVIALGDLFEDLTVNRPVVLILEDAHWADRPSIETIAILHRRLERRRILFLAVGRSDLPAPLEDFRRIELGGLSREATEELVRSILGSGDPLVSSQVDLIHDRSGGNPHFAQELAMALREGQTDLPASVEAVIQARLDALPRAGKDLLRRASVLGRRFWAEALLAMGETDPGAILARLAHRDLVAVADQPRLSGMTEWRFRHGLVQEVAYESLTEVQRVDLHLVAGQWLAERPDAPAVEIARHFEVAARPEAAGQYWRRAAIDAVRQGDAPLALEASARALAGAAGRDAFHLRELRAGILHFAGRRADEEPELEALAALAETDAQKAAVSWRQARLHRLRGRYVEAARCVAEGLRLAPESVPLLVEDALTRAHSGSPAEGIVAARGAAHAARVAGDSMGLGRAQWALAVCHGVLGDIGSALPLFQEALSLFEDAGDPLARSILGTNLAYCDYLLGRYDEAVRALDETRVLCRASGLRAAEGYALQNLGLALARSGRPEAGLEAEGSAHAIAKEVDEPRLELGCLNYRAAILLEAGQPAAALAALEEALARPERGRGPQALETGTLSVVALVALGLREEARAEARRVIALRDEIGGFEGFESDLFLAAHAAGLDGALSRGLELLHEKAAKISDPELRRSFLERVPAHARLVELAAGRGAS
ncbi:MAG: protein kinase [Deltaproteobacteria bacterium]|nr:protein kinase [Deltaproteobacteria bacterium]